MSDALNRRHENRRSIDKHRAKLDQDRMLHREAMTDYKALREAFVAGVHYGQREPESNGLGESERRYPDRQPEASMVPCPSCKGLGRVEAPKMPAGIRQPEAGENTPQTGGIERIVPRTVSSADPPKEPK